MGKTYQNNTKGRRERPAEHKRFGEKRNRDLRKYMEEMLYEDERR